MQKIVIQAGILEKYQKKGQRELKVEGVVEREYVPQRDDWYLLELPMFEKGSSLEDAPWHPTRFFIRRRELRSTREGDSWLLDAETWFEYMPRLALVHNWRVIGGLHELSELQRADVESFGNHGPSLLASP